ncbi:MAG: bifunctional UDP-N-acetylglucosamine diphosphorylase/glucosamine-1-phosphate N-acetyltransferase GlmU [Deltaproteobacteria bacterium]|nr:bifunctional UDP-N-acetylglucosamine diphosphorylase/glucosamine-1-phosphate N-acetyltransferase GlmU [Deltaproteobacteria bacterium]
MGSELPKVITRTISKPLINHVLESAAKLAPERIVVVTGHRRELVEDAVGGDCCVEFAYQEKQLGTGDAVKSALPALQDFKGAILILYGDCPLLTSSTLVEFRNSHVAANATLSFITSRAESPNQYGRVLRSAGGEVAGIREARDCTPEELLISEVNSGVYLVDSSFLKPAVAALNNDNAQGEYYLTDIVSAAVREGQIVNAWLLEKSEELLGVNNLYDLSLVNRVLHMRNTKELIESGVIVEDPATCYVEEGVKVSPGAVLGPNVKLMGSTVVGRGAVIEGTALIKDSQIGEEAVIKLCTRIEGASVGERCSVGPFANIRPGSLFEPEVKIGNFVETKKARLKQGVKASHLTYLGDCTIGENSNIGAGTITCNYDGYKKYETLIGKGVFIGSNTSLVAPVAVHDGATVGAGSVITKDVEKDALAFTRPVQVSKAGWSRYKREKLSK